MANPPSSTPLVTQPAGSNPVANPSVPPQSSPAPAAQPRNAQGLTVAEMSRQAEALSSRGAGTQQTTPVAPTGTAKNSGTISSTRITPLPAQGIEAPGSRAETYTRPSNAAEVARLNNISLSEAEARISRATMAQDQNRLIHPKGVTVSYDPATDTYQDRLTKNYYAGFDPNLGHIFTPDQKNAIKGMFADPTTGGVLTPDRVSTGIRMLDGAITTAENVSMALPFSTERTMWEEPANASKVGSMWESTLPPEYQLLLNEFKADRERLISGQDESSLLLQELRNSMKAREEAEVRSIQDKAQIAIEDQKIANERALGRAKVFFASIGALGSSQNMQYVADTIAGGERALRDIANAERDAVSKARQAYADKDFELAFKQIDLAEKRRQEYKDTLTQTIELKNNFEQMAMKKQEFNMQMESHAMDMETKRLELTGKKDEAAQKKLSNLIEGGYDYESNPEVFNKIGRERGWTPEETVAYTNIIDSAVKSTKAKDQAEADKLAFETANKMLDFFDKTGTSGEISVMGQTYQYQGQPKENVYEGTTTDVGGFMYHWQIDKTTGQRKITPLGPYGKPQDGWSRVQTDQGFFNYNENTGQYVSVTPSDAQSTWSEAFPDGTQSPFRTADDPYQGECAAFNNDCYGQKILGNTFEEKKSTMSKYEVPIDDVQVGDSFLMTSGTTGHVGIVNSVTPTPDGRVQITATESNMVPPGGGVISNTRPMYTDDKRLKMIARIPTPNLPAAGTGTPSTTRTGEPTINGRPISEVMGRGGQGSTVDALAQEVVRGNLPISSVDADIRTQVQLKAADIRKAQTTLPEFDVYASQRAEELGLPDFGTSPQGQMLNSLAMEPFRAEYDARKKVLSSISKVAGKGKNADERAEIKNRLTQYYADGDFTGLEDALKSEAVNQLSATEAGEYRNFENGASAWETASRMIENAPNVGSGPYKALAESKKPWLLIQNDPQYAEIKNIVALGQAPIVKGFYGASVSGGEAQRANEFLVKPDDTLQMMQIKLRNGANYLRFVNDATVASQLGLPHPNLDDYLE